jgi:iron complex transport system substrate-binding protein
MNQPAPWIRLLPSLLLLLLAGTIAAAVDHFVLPADNDLSARPGKGYGNSAIRTGAMEYPRQAIDSDSFVVRVAKPVRRIVSQYWSIDEYVYSIVPPERVVAVSASAYQEAMSNVYAQVQRYHPVIATDPERVLRLNPDLLIVSNGSRADFCAIVRSAQVPIYRAFTTFSTLEQIAETIRLTGYLTGEDSAAAAQIEKFWSDIDRAKARRPSNANPPRILGLGGNFSYGDETLFHDIVRVLGGVNVGAEGGLKGYAEVNSEQIIRWNPEWIVAAADKGKTKEVLARLMADPAITLTQAARNGHVLVFEYHIFLPMSPYARLFVTALAAALYG